MVFNDEYIYLNLSIRDNNKIFIEGYVKNPSQYKKMVLLASNPIDRMVNYSGSGLPFPNEHIAFENTKNIFQVSGTGVINTVFSYPNSFYSRNGKNKILPSIYIELVQGNNEPFQLQYKLDDFNTLRSLINRESRQGPAFYSAKDAILPIDTAENVMHAYVNAKLLNNIG